VNPQTDLIDKLSAALATRRFGRYCRWFDTVDSTNSLALTWAKEGAPTGALVVAEFQERGRGRFNRSWTAEPGSNLTFSLIAGTEEFEGSVAQIPIALAVAAAETVSLYLEPHHPSIKWPNDVLVAEKKVAGILVESSIASSRRARGGHVVAGIGINVNQSRFPPELAHSATSLLQIQGRPTDRIQFLADLLLSIEQAFDALSAGKVSSIIARYEHLLTGKGEAVSFRRLATDDEVEGTILGVDPSGGLRVRTRSRIEVLRAGEVTLRPGSKNTPTVTHLPDTSHTSSS
jgi:BirA family biotin operon repressor/biotin-[acetyl-CoA-carboxylase] ligase